MSWSDPLGYFPFAGWSGFPLSAGAPSWQLQAAVVQLHLAMYERWLALGGTNDLPNIKSFVPDSSGMTVPYILKGDDVNFLFGDYLGVESVPTYYMNSGDSAYNPSALQAWFESAYPDVSDYPTHMPPIPESAYGLPPMIKIHGGDGTGALAAVGGYGSGGSITAITIIDGGSGYTVAPTATASGGSGTGFACGAVTISGGAVTAVAITAAGTGYGAGDVPSCQGAWGGGATGGEYDSTPVYDTTFELYYDQGGPDEQEVSKWIAGIGATLRFVQEMILAAQSNFVIYPAVGGDDYDGYTGGTWDWTGDSTTFYTAIPNFNFYKLASNAGVTVGGGAGPGPDDPDTIRNNYIYRRYYRQFKHLFGNTGTYTDEEGDTETYSNSPSTTATDGSVFADGQLAIHSGDNQQDTDAEGFVGFTDGSGAWNLIESALRPGTGRVFERMGGDIQWGTLPWTGSPAHTYSGDLAAVSLLTGNSTLSSASYDFGSDDVSKPIWINGAVFFISSVDAGVAEIYGDCTSEVLAGGGSAYMSGWALQKPGTRPDVLEGAGFIRRDDIITAQSINETVALINHLRWTQSAINWVNPDSEPSTGSGSCSIGPGGIDSDSWSDYTGGVAGNWSTGVGSGAPFGYSEGEFECEGYTESMTDWGLQYGVPGTGATGATQKAKGQVGSLAQGIVSPLDTRFDPHTVACEVDYLTYAGLDSLDDAPYSTSGVYQRDGVTPGPPNFIGLLGSAAFDNQGIDDIAYHTWKKFSTSGPAVSDTQTSPDWLGSDSPPPDPAPDPLPPAPDIWPVPSDHSQVNLGGSGQTYLGWGIVGATGLIRWDVSGGFSFVD